MPNGARPLLDVAEVPLIDEKFYGDLIRSFTSELKAIGVAVDVHGAQRVIAIQFKTMLSSCSPTFSNVISLLNCIKCARGSMTSLLPELKSCLTEVNFLKTRHGYKSAQDSILFDAKWGEICQFVDLPLIDDSFYGIRIYGYRCELRLIGVLVDLSEGSHLVASGIQLPKDNPGDITAEAALTLLQCIGFLMKKQPDGSLPEFFLNNIRESNWLKTTMGYRSPEHCLLYDSAWESIMETGDGPFLDHVFYGKRITLYRDELAVLGVKVEVEDVCMLLYKSLVLHNSSQVITRIYTFLSTLRWKPRSVDGRNYEVWIPGKKDGGQWVNSMLCVFYDKDDLFCSNDFPIHVLDKYYPKSLRRLFSLAFGVPHSPTLFHYVVLWKKWELDDQHELTTKDCCSFWEYAISNWDVFAEFLKENISKLPATSNACSKIYVTAKTEIFIPDDVELEMMFNDIYDGPLFVWCPQSSTSIPQCKLYQIYNCLGVKKLSELVSFDASCGSLGCKHENLVLRNELIVEGIIRIFLGFLAGPRVRMSVKERHEIVKRLLELPIYETEEPVTVSCILKFPTGKKSLESKTNRMIYWDKDSHKLFVHRSSYEENKTSIEFISYFSKAITNVLLSKEIASLANELCNILQTGFIFGFKEDVVKFLMKTENLQIFLDDEELICTAFNSEKSPTTSGLELSLREPLTSETSNARAKRKRPWCD